MSVSVRRSLGARVGNTLVAVALAIASLTACSHVPVGEGDSHTPDVFDKVRNIDLMPRFPLPMGAGGETSGMAVRAQVYPGDPAPAIEAPPPQEQVTRNGQGYQLNFENTPVASVAKVVLGDLLSVGYTIDPRVQGTVSLSSGRPVPKSDLLFVLENALRLSGVVLVHDTIGYRLVPQGDAVGGGNVDAQAARAEPGYGISVVPLQYVSVATLTKLLDSFATRPGTVRADATRNMLLIQGSGPERRSAIDTVLAFDVDWMRGQSVGIFPVQYSNPEPVIAELEKIMDTKDGGLNSNNVKFQLVARMNAILVVTRKPEMLRRAETWIKRLDAADTARAGVHVYRVKYGEARQLARVLNAVFVTASGGGLDNGPGVAPGSGLATSTSTRGGLGGQGSEAQSSAEQGSGGFGNGFGSRSGTGGLGSRGGFGSTPSTLGATRTAAAGEATGSTDLGGAAGGAGGNQPVLEGVRITPDTSTNSLLVFASTENYRIIEQTLRQLDQPQLQVGIDATVAEVTLNDNLSYGVQFFLQSQNIGLPADRGSAMNVPSSPPGNEAAVLGHVAPFLTRAFPGFNFLIGSELNPHMILDALHGVTNVKVLSNPSLVVINNQLATLTVGDEIPVSTGTGNVLNAATGTSNTIINSIDYRNTGIILRVIPRVSVNGNVQLDVEQEISQVSNGTQGSLTPTVAQRKVKSSIAVASGQTVLLAGLIQERSEVDRNGIPILDQIPKIGDVFSHQNKTIVRTELIIFIRPQIIRDSVDAHFVAEELRTKLRGTIQAVPSEVPVPHRVRP
jgi:general secretion pathway protein D